jgi:hypothetical protein
MAQGRTQKTARLSASERIAKGRVLLAERERAAIPHPKDPPAPAYPIEVVGAPDALAPAPLIDRYPTVFKGVGYYSALPAKYTIGKGLDLAYTAKTRADHSAGLVLLKAGRDFLVAHVVRRQLEIDKFVPFLVAQSAVFPGAYRFSASTTERGIAQLSRLLPTDSIRIISAPALVDKFVHSQRSASYWNTDDKGLKPRRILVPDEAAQAQIRALGLDTDWVKPFLEEMERFTGVGDAEDDQCDALFNAIDTFPKDAPDPPPPSAYGFSAGVDPFDLKP